MISGEGVESWNFKMDSNVHLAPSLKISDRAEALPDHLAASPSFLHFSTFSPECLPHQRSPSEFNYPWVSC